MKVVAKTDEYTIYQRRDQRYAVKNTDRQWVNGDAKIAILVERKLIDLPAPKPAAEPEPPVAADAPAAEEAGAEAAEAGAETAEAGAETADAEPAAGDAS